MKFRNKSMEVQYYMQKEFTPLVEEAAMFCKKYFMEKLLAIYLHGSIATNDAIPYVSDLDCYIVTSKELSNKDKKYLEQTECELQLKYPIINGVHLSAHSAKNLMEDPFARFLLKYNSILYIGNDIVKRLDESGCEKFEPNAKMAKGRLAFARQCFQQALEDKQPMCTGELPSDTYYISRKYARYFVIIEGAYFLMSQNQFESFDQKEILNKLYQHTDEFKQELDITCLILENPKKAGIKHIEFLKQIRPLVEWMFHQIDQS